MKLDIFSDVICTWSYGEEKVLRAIDYIYDGQIEFKNTMGIIFNDYKDVLPMNMKDRASDEVANNILLSIWRAGVNIHKMPVMTSAPNLISDENPGTQFISRGFVTFRIIKPELANEFLRELRLATILYGKNTMDLEVLADIAEEFSVDRDEFKEVFENQSMEEFLSDRMKCFDRRFERYPNFMYTDEGGKEYILKGYKTKEELMGFIDRFSDIPKREITLDEESVKEFIRKYKKVFIPEIVEVFGQEEEVNKILETLENEDFIKIEKVGTGKEITLEEQ
ncbi:MAG: DsbA family protein [Peptoniphilus sp.]|nr:DsbA family protein [Peptoniphilus sp.]